MVDPPYRMKNMMPGMIMLWYGSVATIPSGWHLCDGTMGTPDLLGKFVISTTGKLSYKVTTNSVPSVNGNYNEAGEHSGKPYYNRDDNAWFIWWNGVDTWYISSVLGVQGTYWWHNPSPETAGTYTAGGSAAGFATAAEVISYPPGAAGGSVEHDHAWSSGYFYLDFIAGTEVAAGTDFDNRTDFHLLEGDTTVEAHLPPYYALCYIMKTN